VPLASVVADPPTPVLLVTPRLIPTRHGRLLFLVNRLLADGLYPDFTRPHDAGFPLPIWALLARLGVALIGPRLRHDPLWRLLGHWAGETTLPAHARHQARARGWPTGSPNRWIARYAQPLRRTLAQTLDIPPTRLRRALTQTPPARLWVSEAEIVAVFPLDHHPVAWRLAGLDRDPGPLPGSARALRFVFE
jgi:hypothetical protein